MLITQNDLLARMDAMLTNGARFEAWINLADDLEEEMRGLVGGERRSALRERVKVCKVKAAAAAHAEIQLAVAAAHAEIQLAETLYKALRGCEDAAARAEVVTEEDA